MAIPRTYPRLSLALLLALALLAPTLALTPAARADDCQVTSPNDSGAGTLRALLGGACATITFQAGLGQVSLTSRLEIARDVTIQGPGAASLALAYTGAPSAFGSVIWVHGGTVVLKGLTLTGGKTDGIWGAGLTIYDGVSGATAVTLDGVTVTQNSAKNAGGGGIYASSATLHLVNSVVSDNTADNSAYNNEWGGGGLFLDDGNGSVAATLTGTTVAGNQAPLNVGGGIRLWHKGTGHTATLDVTGGTIGGISAGANTAASGGGLQNDGGTATLTNVTISGNTAFGDFPKGGGLANINGTLTLQRSTVTRNGLNASTVAFGGGIFIGNGTTTVTDSTISGNFLSSANAAEGAGIRQVGGTLTVSGSTISGNDARTIGGKGGGIFNNAGAVTVTNSTVSGNMAGAIGGGIRNLNDGGTIALSFVTVVGNSAPAAGGISGAGGGLTYGQSIIAGNTSNSTPDDCSDTVTSQGYNVAGADCPATGPGDRALASGQALSTVVNPTLADNGGVATPHTLTHALAPGSPALAAATGCPATDQRGVARPQSGMCDSGAYEATPPAPSPSPSANPSPSSSANPSPSPSVVPSPSPSTGPCGTRFGDVPASDPACVAIEALAARGVINGCDSSATPPLFCPNDPTLRHQMAALIVRAIPDWAGETGQPSFSDNTDDTELMQRVATLQRHGVVRGYQDEVCTSQGKTPPCYGPLDTVKYGQVLLFIARAMVAKGYWTLQPDDRTIFPDQNGAPGADPATDQQTRDHQMVVTYVHYVGAPPDVADVHAPFLVAGVAHGGWGDDSTRAWFTRAFWPAIRDH